jgi:hypothetical protein
MAKSNLVSLRYNFIFAKGAGVWGKLYEFEKDLADFFKTNGLKAELLSPIEGSGSEGIMWIKKTDSGDEFLTNSKGANLPKSLPPGKPQVSAHTVNQMTNRLVKQMKGKK